MGGSVEKEDSKATCFFPTLHSFVGLFYFIFNLFEYSSIRFSEIFREKKQLHLYMYVECAYIYQNTSTVHNSCLFLAAQLTPFSMLPFRYILLFSIWFLHSMKLYHMLFRPVTLCLCGWNAKNVPSQRPPLVFTLESDILVLMSVYDIAFIRYWIPLQHSALGARRGGNEGRV